MAKLHFYYSTMNAGKSTHLLQANFNYKTDSHNTLLIKPAIDDRFGETQIASRIGISEKAISVSPSDSLYNLVKEHNQKNHLEAVFIDEVQFFNRDQIHQLSMIVDNLDIPVLAYGLRNNFKGELFEGSKALFEVANNLNEIKTICHCGHKANMVLRYNKDGEVCRDGAEIEIGAEDRYVSTCRKHFIEGDIGNTARSGLKETDKLNKEIYASIVSRVLKMTYQDSLDYADSDKNVFLSKLENEIKEQESLKNITEDSYRKNVLSKSISALHKCYFKIKNI